MLGFGMRGRSVRSLVLAALLWLAFAAMPALAAEPALAIGGYDPVAYFTQGGATKGDPRYEYVWDDVRYRFASAENRELFKADPARYAPQFPGLCAISLANGVKFEADPQYWLVSDGKLYLFGKAIGPDKFRHGLAENVARANDNWRRVQSGEALVAARPAQ
jgi:YHS domain-containing protein